MTDFDTKPKDDWLDKPPQSSNDSLFLDTG